MERYRRAFYILLLVTTIFRLFYIRWVELAPDEAYYWTWSRNLQWGYYDHPPMIGFLIKVFTTLAGQSEFGVRVGWVLIGFLLTILLYRMAKVMFQSERAGFYAALVGNVSLVAATGAVIVTPDGPQGLFWVLAIWFVFKAVESEKARWWYGAGFAFGFGLFSKYTAILLAPCIFFFLLSSPEGRGWFFRKEPYLALVLGLLIFSPVILWNSMNDWVSFKFQIAHGLEMKKAAGLKTFGDFWAGQAGVVTPLLFLAVLGAMFSCAIRGFRHRKQSLLLLFWTSAPIFFFFAVASWRGKVEANWPALAYFPGFAALAGIAAEGWPTWGKGRKGFAGAVVLSAFLITAAAHLQPLYPLIPIPPKKDPTSQLQGWRALGQHIEKEAGMLDPAKGIFLLTPRHQLVGEGMFYTRGKIPIYQWDAPHRINRLSARNSPPIGSEAIFFSEGGRELPPGVGARFEMCSEKDSLTIKRGEIPIRTHPFWKCTGFKGMK